MKKFITMIVVFALSLSACLYAITRPPSAAAYADKKSLRVGDKVVVTIRASSLSSFSVDIGPLIFGSSNVRVLDQRTRRASFCGRDTISSEHIVMMTAPGEYVIPDVAASFYSRSTGETVRIMTKSVTLSVRSAVIGSVNEDFSVKMTDQMNRGQGSSSVISTPIYFKIYDKQTPWHRYSAPYIISISAGLLSFITIVFVVLRLKRALKKETAKSALEIFYDRISGIENDIKSANRDPKDCCYKLTEALKDYFTARFSIARQFTSGEFLSTVSSSKRIIDKHKSAIRDIIIKADKVKYALEGMDRAEILELLKKAVMVVEEIEKEVK